MIRHPDIDRGGPLFSGRATTPDGAVDAPTSFATFHADNPHVYERLRSLALAQVEAGATRGGIAQLYEVLRYEASIRTHGDAYKLNHNYRAPYARLLMKSEPRLRGFFELRASAADQREDV